MAQSNKDLARIDYLHGMKYKELAEKYGVTLSTVKSWKTRYKWERKSLQKDKKTHTKPKKSTHTNKSTQAVEELNKKVEEKIDRDLERSIDKLLVNDQFNDKQKLFCMYYIKRFNATKAYQQAYNCTYETAVVNGPRLLGVARIRAEIERLKADKFKGAMLSAKDWLQKYIDIALADVNDYMKYGHEKIPMIDKKTGEQRLDENGKPIYWINNYVILNDSSQVDGTLITEISQGKDGIKVKLLDKKFALEFLRKCSGLLDIETQQKLDIERRKMELAEKNADTLDDDIEYAVEGGTDEDKEKD